MGWYAILADFIVAVHFGYVLFVVFALFVILLGGFLRWRLIRNFWFRAVHLTMILIVVFESLAGMMCPLTVWEYNLRIAAGQNVSDVSFVARLIHYLIFFDFPPIVFAIGYSLFGLAVIGSWLLYPPDLPWKQKNRRT